VIPSPVGFPPCTATAHRQSAIVKAKKQKKKKKKKKKKGMREQRKHRQEDKITDKKETNEDQSSNVNKEKKAERWGSERERRSYKVHNFASYSTSIAQGSG
jgi:hypothetical protein